MLPDLVLVVLSVAVVVLGVATLVVLVAHALEKEARALILIADGLARWLIRRWRSFQAFLRGVDKAV